MTIVGVDIGLRGAIAVDTGEVTRVHRMPVADKKYDLQGIAALLEPLRGQEVTVVVERQGPRPGFPPMVIASLARGEALIEALCAAYHLPVKKVSPVVWKRAAGLLKQGKKASVAKARELMPQAIVTRHDEAEAVLIAWWGRRGAA